MGYDHHNYIDIDKRDRDEHLTKFGWSFGISIFAIIFMWWWFIASADPITPITPTTPKTPTAEHVENLPSVSEIKFRKPIPKNVMKHVTIVQHYQHDRAIWKGNFREGIYFISTDDVEETSPVGAIEIPEGFNEVVPPVSESYPSWNKFLFWFLSPLILFIAFMTTRNSWIYCIGGFFNLIRSRFGRPISQAVHFPFMVLASVILGSNKELNWGFLEGEEPPPAWKDSIFRRIQKRMFPWAYKFDLKHRALFSSAWIWNNSPNDRNLVFGAVNKKDFEKVITNLNESKSNQLQKRP